MVGNRSLQPRLLQSYAHRLNHNNSSNDNNNDNNNNNDNDNQVCREANKIGQVVPRLTDLIWQSLEDYMVALSPVTRWLRGWGEGGFALSGIKCPRQRQNFVYTSERPQPRAATFSLRHAESQRVWSARRAALILSELTMTSPPLCSSYQRNQTQAFQPKILSDSLIISLRGFGKHGTFST